MTHSFFENYSTVHDKISSRIFLSYSIDLLEAFSCIDAKLSLLSSRKVNNDDIRNVNYGGTNILETSRY